MKECSHIAFLARGAFNKNGLVDLRIDGFDDWITVEGMEYSSTNNVLTLTIADRDGEEIVVPGQRLIAFRKHVKSGGWVL